jgi:hypothetical protein
MERGPGGEVLSRRDSAARPFKMAGTRELPAGKKFINGGGNNVFQTATVAFG